MNAELSARVAISYSNMILIFSGLTDIREEFFEK